MDDPPRPSRRRLPTDRLARRKRTIIACQFCRVRKTRCDGVKPTCGFCQRHDARCVWGIGPESDDGYQGSPVERELLHRLDDIKSLLQTVAQPLNHPPTEYSLPSSSSRGHDVGPASPTTESSHASNRPSVSPSSISYVATRCESLLRWPVFQEMVEPRDAAIESFVLETDGIASNGEGTGPPPLSGNATTRPGIQEHCFVPLCRKFLAHVHPRNPILEASKLVEYAKHAAENGLAWDGPSCLVLIACALACYTSPWQGPAANTPEPCDGLQDSDIAAAEAYYLAAQKRIGLLAWSVVDIQCLFFASVYEKYALNPLQAWLSIQQASVRLQAHLKRQQRLSKSYTPSTSNASDQDLVQRLFWSIYKAENELLPELPFKSSGIEDLTRSDSMFPSPPTISNHVDSSCAPSTEELNSKQEEQSWFFYLAEISLRRTINDTLWLLYRKGEQYWITHIRYLEQQHDEAERQISLWYSHLPPCIQFNPAHEADNEFSFYLQGRFYEWREYSLRPFLFYALHQPEGHIVSPGILSFARESVIVCTTGIIYNDRHHRHGGTWLVCRRTFVYALIILGVALKGNKDVPPPVNWHQLINKALETLSRWDSRCIDLYTMRTTLERIFHIICKKIEAR